MDSGCAEPTPNPAASGGLEVRRRLLAPLRHHLESDPLVLGEVPQPGCLHRRDVHEHVLAATLGLDEAVALLGVEPLHGAGGHATLPLWTEAC